MNIMAQARHTSICNFFCLFCLLVLMSSGLFVCLFVFGFFFQNPRIIYILANENLGFQFTLHIVYPLQGCNTSYKTVYDSLIFQIISEKNSKILLLLSLFVSHFHDVWRTVYSKVKAVMFDVLVLCVSNFQLLG